MHAEVGMLKIFFPTSGWIGKVKLGRKMKEQVFSCKINAKYLLVPGVHLFTFFFSSFVLDMYDNMLMLS